MNDINKLSQLDRIEFRHKLEEIEKDSDFSSMNRALKLSLILTLFVMMTDIWQYMHTSHWFTIPMWNKLGIALGIYIVLMFIIDITYMIISSKNKDKLFKEYFETLPKKKAKKVKHG